MRVAVVTRKRPDRHGDLPLYLRIQHGRTVYVSLGFRVRPADWNARRREVRASYGPGADEMNALLREKEVTARDAARSVVLALGREATADEVKAAVEDAIHPGGEEEERVGFLSFARAEVKRAHEDRGGVSTALAYGSALNNFEAFLTEEGHRPASIEASDVNATMLRRHAEWLARPEPAGKGHAPNYVAKQLGVIRWALGRAAEGGHPGAADALRQGKSVRVKRERVERKRLTLDQVRTMREMSLKGRAADVRDWFVFAFFAGGLRFSDVCRLRWSHVKRDGEGKPVGYALRQTKTGKPLTLPLAPEAAEVLTRWEARTGPGGRRPTPYVFALIEEAEEADPKRRRKALDKRAALARKYLKAICESQGWPVVGTHGARHGLADHMRKSGADLYSISKVLGHTNLRTTEHYLRGFDEEHVGQSLLDALRPREDR